MIDFKLEATQHEGGPKDEIERKWKVEKLPKGYKKWERSEIKQGYLKKKDGSEHRIRKEGNKYTETKKGPTTLDGSKRSEDEETIGAIRFTLFWFLTKGRRVYKTRYKKEIDGVVVELDIYKRKLKDIIVVEIEFPDDEAKNKFERFDWFGDEVTSDPNYKNHALAVKGKPEEE